MNRAVIASLLATLLLVACGGNPKVQTGEDAEVINGNLVRVDNTTAKMVYVDPDVHFSKYTSIQLAPLGVDNVEIVQPSGSYAAGNRNWELTEADKQSLQRDFQQAMAKYLQEKGGYPLVAAAGDNVLRITPMLTRIAPNAPKDDFQSRPAGRNKVYTEGSGKLGIAVVFSDSETGEVVALVKDTRSGSSIWGVNNQVVNAAEVRRIFTSWAMQIRAQLDRVHTTSGKD